MAHVTINLAAMEGLAQAKAVKGIQRAALQGEARVKAILSQPGSGRMYGKHQSSAPGEPPAPDSGQLRAATQADTQVREMGSDLVGRIVANKEYAHALEVGTERIAPRPFFGPLATDHADELRQAFIQGARE